MSMAGGLHINRCRESDAEKALGTSCCAANHRVLQAASDGASWRTSSGIDAGKSIQNHPQKSDSPRIDSTAPARSVEGATARFEFFL